MTLALPPERVGEPHDEPSSPERHKKHNNRRRVIGAAVAAVAVGASGALLMLRGGQDSSEEVVSQDRAEEVADTPGSDSGNEVIIDEPGELEFSIDTLIAEGEVVDYENEAGERNVFQLDNRWSAEQIEAIEEIARAPLDGVSEEQLEALVGGLGFSDEMLSEIETYPPTVIAAATKESRYLSHMTLGLVPFVEGYRGYDVAVDENGNGFFVDRINPTSRLSAEGVSYEVRAEEAELLPADVQEALQQPTANEQTGLTAVENSSDELVELIAEQKEALSPEARIEVAIQLYEEYTNSLAIEGLIMSQNTNLDFYLLKVNKIFGVAIEHNDPRVLWAVYDDVFSNHTDLTYGRIEQEMLAGSTTLAQEAQSRINAATAIETQGLFGTLTLDDVELSLFWGGKTWQIS